LPTDFHQFDVFMTLGGMTADEDFQTAVFDVVLGPGVTPNLLFGTAYSGDPSSYDPPPNGAPLLPLFTTNTDAGIANDLKAITVVANSTNNHAGVHFRHPGEVQASSSTDPDNSNLPPPTFLGSVFVNWTGIGSSYVGLSDPNNVTNVWSTVKVSDNGAILYQAGSMNQGPNQVFGIPEPATLSLVGLAVIGSLGFLRRR
jgi:hypothetical protein